MVNEQAVVVFDDERVVANASVMLPALLARRLGIGAQVDASVDLGERAGAANPWRKVMTMCLGADCIEAQGPHPRGQPGRSRLVVCRPQLPGALAFVHPAN